MSFGKNPPVVRTGMLPPVFWQRNDAANELRRMRKAGRVIRVLSDSFVKYHSESPYFVRSIWRLIKS